MNVIMALVDLQDTDGLIRDCEQKTKDIPQRKAQELARLKGAISSLELAKGQLEAVRARIAADEAEAKRIRERVQELKIAQTSIASNKEMQQSILAIETLEREIEGAENRALEATIGEIPPIEKAEQEAQARLDAERATVDEYVKELDGMLAEASAELQELQAVRKEKVDLIRAADPRALFQYERTRTKRWPAVVQLNEDDVCEGCHMKQPQFVKQMAIRQRMAAEKGPVQIVSCTMCGRILYQD